MDEGAGGGGSSRELRFVVSCYEWASTRVVAFSYFACVFFIVAIAPLCVFFGAGQFPGSVSS